MNHSERGRRLVQLREARGWSRAELARQSGVADTTIKIYEDGHRPGTTVPGNPRVATLKLLAGAFGYPDGVELLRDFGHPALAETFEREALLPEEHQSVNRHVSGPAAERRGRLASEYEWFLEEVRDLVVRLSDKIERGPGRAA